VVALGGGAFLSPANRDLAAGNGVSVWLDCDFDRIARRVAQATHRPLARDPEKLAALFDERRDIYRLADVHIPSKRRCGSRRRRHSGHPFFR